MTRSSSSAADWWPRNRVGRAAETSMRLHGFYGVSVFAAAAITIEQLVQETPELSPERYRQLRSSTVGRVRSTGFAVLATQERPHFDVELPDAGCDDRAVAKLLRPAIPEPTCLMRE